MPAASAALRGRYAREQPEGAIDVQPRSVPSGQVGHRLDGVERARVHLAGVGHDDGRRSVEGDERSLQRRHVEATAAVGGETVHVAAADAQHRQRLQGAGVDIAAAEHRQRRQSGQARLLDVGAMHGRPPMTGCREGGEVGHRGARGQHATPAGRQREEVLEPVDGDGFGAGRQRRVDPREGVLVDGAGQPVGGEGGRRHAAGHEMEHARTAGPVGIRKAVLDELVDGTQAAQTGLRQRPAQQLDIGGVDAVDGCLDQFAEVGRCRGMGRVEACPQVALPPQRVVFVGHAGEATPTRRCYDRTVSQPVPHLRAERRLWQQGRLLVVGVDEVGMGALCAPVVAAAVLVRPNTRKIAGVRDSKTLSARQRDRLVEEIKRRSLAWGVGAASVGEIERLNIYHASHVAMRRALRRIPGYDHVLVDGRKIVGFEDQVGPYTSIVDGDASSYAIACASVLAKVTRDRLMARLALRYPGYGWERNAGYATREHVAGLRELGLTPFHRRTYQRIRAIIEGDQLAFELPTPMSRRRRVDRSRAWSSPSSRAWSGSRGLTHRHRPQPAYAPDKSVGLGWRSDGRDGRTVAAAAIG